MIFSIIIFVITLMVLVVIHEFGHFIMAKKFGIKVEEFGFGLPPRIWGKKVGETLYSINWLPIGGFVRLYGEDEVSTRILEHARSFASANVWKRIIVVLAGILMNFCLAFIIFYIVLGAQGFKTEIPYSSNYHFVGVKETIKPVIFISDVAKNSPASISGVRAGDKVVAINGKLVQNSAEVIDTTKKSAGVEMSLTLENSQDEKRIVSVIPRKNPPKGQGALGIALYPVNVASVNFETPIQKIFAGPIHAWNITAYSGVTMGELINKSFKDKSFKPVSATVAGPVGITSVANSILQSQPNPIIPYLNFVALISLNLAVFNLLPIPALDGGRLFFLLIEALTKRKVNPEFEAKVHGVGMMVLLALTALITFSDIKKLF